MAGTLNKLACCMLLLSLAGTVSAGFAAAGWTGTASPLNQPVAGSVHGSGGFGTLTGGSGATTMGPGGCYFPIWRLPEYYVCIMFCKIGGGDACASSCEANLIICPA
jgi:hypothetical protein